MACLKSRFPPLYKRAEGDESGGQEETMVAKMRKKKLDRSFTEKLQLDLYFVDKKH